MHGRVLAITVIFAAIGAASPADGRTAPDHGAGASCGGLTATIVGTPGDDEILGTSGLDIVWADAGDDVVDGFGGDDVICGADGDDVVRGGDGDDHLMGDSGDDLVSGGGGDDLAFGLDGKDEIHGDLGVDRISGGPGSDRLFAGDDPGSEVCYREACEQLSGGRGADVLDGGPGGDIDGVRFDADGTESVRVDLRKGKARGEGRDRLISVEGVTTFGDSDDVIIGDDSNNDISSAQGADLVRTFGGDDRISGISLRGRFVTGRGADLVRLSFNPTSVRTGAGDDTVYLSQFEGRAEVVLDLGPGDDELSMSGDHPNGRVVTTIAGPGDDQVESDSIADDMDGGDGDDLLDAGTGTRDRGDGGAGVDRCQGFEDVVNCER